MAHSAKHWFLPTECQLTCFLNYALAILYRNNWFGYWVIFVIYPKWKNMIKCICSIRQYLEFSFNNKIPFILLEELLVHFSFSVFLPFPQELVNSVNLLFLFPTRTCKFPQEWECRHVNMGEWWRHRVFHLIFYSGTAFPLWLQVCSSFPFAFCFMTLFTT